MPTGIYKRKSMSKKVKEKIRLGNKGKVVSDETKRKLKASAKKRAASVKGKRMMKEVRAKSRQVRLGVKLSNVHKARIGKGNSGKKRSEKTKLKIGEASKGRNLGSKSPLWRGGISFEPYTTDWTETLRRSIRERDNYTCQMPGCNKQQGDITFPVHHIDYNKSNSNPNNLVTLCRSCHTKTNYNREYYTALFITFFL